MDTWWPWLAMAGAGALHGLNPAAGWALAAGCSLHARDRALAWRALVPIGAGHLASMGLIAAAVALGRAIDRTAMGVLAGVLLVGGLTRLVRRRERPGGRRAVSPAMLALVSFLVSTTQGGRADAGARADARVHPGSGRRPRLGRCRHGVVGHARRGRRSHGADAAGGGPRGGPGRPCDAPGRGLAPQTFNENGVKLVSRS
jgi:hypothetical protein